MNDAPAFLRIRYLTSLIEGANAGPYDDRPWRLDETIADLAPEEATACVVNGRKITPADEDWHKVPLAGSSLTFVLTEKDPISLTVMATALAVGYAGSAAFTAGFIGLGVAAAIGTAASLAFTGAGLYNAFKIGSALFRRPGMPEVGENQSTYGFGDVSAVPANGATIPVLYGEHPVAGLLIEQSTSEGSDNNQRYDAQFVLSHGPIQAIGDADTGTNQSYTTDQTDLADDNIPGGTWINGAIVESNTFRDFKVSTRLGSLTQTPMRRQVKRQFVFDKVQRKDGEPFRYETRGVCDSVEVDLLFHEGLVRFRKTDGKAKTASVVFRLRIYDVADLGSAEYDEEITVSKKLTRPVFFTKTVLPGEAGSGSGLTASRKLILLERLSGDDDDDLNRRRKFRVIAVREVQSVALAHPGLAGVAVGIQANEQLSGGVPAFTFHGKGKKVQTSDGSSWSGTGSLTWTSNPAWIAADILTSPVYGLGNWHSYADLDPGEWKDWADFCDEAVDLYTGAGSTEARAEFHGVFDSPDRAWEQVLRVAAVGLAGLVRNGRSVTPVLQEDRTPTCILNSASVNSPSITYSGAAGRPNVVDVRFRNREKPGHEMDVATARVEGLDESSDSVRRAQIDLLGCVSPWQARRAAYRILREFTLSRRVFSGQVGLDLLQVAPGDVFRYSNDDLTFSHAGGKLVSGDDSPAETVLDREVTFAAGVIYTYFEASLIDDTLLSKDFSYPTLTTTDTLDFEPLHGGGSGDPPVIGRPYLIAKKGDDRLFRVVSIGAPVEGLRKVEAVEHVPGVFTDDAPPLETGDEAPTLSAVNSASAVSVTETSDTDDESILTVAFTPGAGSNKRHRVHYRIGSDGLGFGAEAASSPISFRLIVPTGTPVTVYVQSINSDGAMDSFASWPSATYVIQREDGGQTIINIPDAITAASFTGVSGNTATLEWTPGADYDALNDTFEVRVGAWNEGRVIYEGAADSVAVVRPATGTRYQIRTKRDGYYSPSGYLDSAAVAHASYATATLTASIALQSTGTATNLVAIPDWHAGNGALLQILPEVPVSYLSETFDAATSAATHVSVDARVFAYFTPLAEDDFYTSMQHVGPFGELAKTYLDWTLLVEHSTDNATWTAVDWADYANADLIVTARYFRLRFTASALATEDDATTRLGLVLLESLNLALRRA